MRVKRCLLVAGTAAVLCSATPALCVEGPGPFFKRLLRSAQSRSFSKTQAKSPRIAQSRSRNTAPERAAPIDPRVAEEQAKRMQANIERQLSSVQQQLNREEQRLGAQLADLAKQRQAAVEKGDEQKLKQIESRETAVVKGYEGRVQRILTGASPKGLQQRPNVRAPTRAGPSPSKSAPKPEQPQRRRIRFWPFG